ncbi:ABC transporter permease [Streptomyces samsunensis]|uniref:ABC transporter permease n=1 Tax=Streptomyces TaxID=1883 RepID=UPI00081E89E4|nr:MULTISPECIES: ABC transporter permease [Streptomyces]MYU13935.1 ABC transporter permease [Streptomyces sp. SID8361]NUH43457.1 ABC transporter permease [Streptomyces samsunensis]SCG03436.1 ribose transport system permease protein [Streptomyces sp. MnatMP-M27]
MTATETAPEAGAGADLRGGVPIGPRVIAFARDYAALILLVAIFVTLSIISSSFLSFTNVMNILNQNTPLAIIAVAGTFVIVSGAFDLSTAAMYAVVSVVAASVATSTGSTWTALLAAPVLGLVMGVLNGLAVTRLNVHSFLATLASSLVYKAVAVLITGGSLITVTTSGFSDLGRGQVAGVFYSVLILLAVFALASLLLNGTVFGRHVFAVGGNSDAAHLSGVRVDRVKVTVFALSGLAVGIAGAIGVSRLASGQPQAGSGLELQAIAAIILGGSSIYGGIGAVWRSLVGVYLIALIGNGFDILNVNPQMKDLVTGVIILAAVALAAADRRRR